MNRQQHVWEIVGTNFINEKDIYKLQQNVWLVHSMMNMMLNIQFESGILTMTN